MENQEFNTQIGAGTTPVSGEPPSELTPEQIRQRRKVLITAVVGGIIVLAGVIALVYYLLLDTTPTDKWRDILIIFMALEFLVIGFTMVILIVQLATLINLIQNELKPILDSTNETVNTLRGTATFLSDNLVEPVVKVNSYLAAFKRLFDILSG
jgi:amino acid permease